MGEGAGYGDHERVGHSPLLRSLHKFTHSLTRFISRSNSLIQKPRSAGDPLFRAPSALDLTTLPFTTPAEASTRAGLIAVHDMVQAGWPALPAALSFLISTNLSDELFVDVLASYQALMNVAGMLGLSIPRYAFLTSLSKSAITSRVISSLESYTEPPTPRTAISFSKGLGALASTVAGGGEGGTPGLSERNMACWKVLVESGRRSDPPRNTPSNRSPHPTPYLTPASSPNSHGSHSAPHSHPDSPHQSVSYSAPPSSSCNTTTSANPARRSRNSPCSGNRPSECDCFGGCGDDGE